MKLRTTTKAHRLAPRMTALAAASTLLLAGFAGVMPAQAEELTPTQSVVTAPETIPSLDSWVSGEGTYSLGQGATVNFDGANSQLESIAEILGAELRTLESSIATSTEPADAGDIELVMDPSRTDLGDEGYDLEISDTITITGAKYSGVFYGTRTILQWLTQQNDLPFGTATDIPTYEERGVTLCACVINVSTEFIDRLIEEMSYLKLNTLMVELKVKVDGYPETNTWSYYTKDDIRTLVTKANKYGIDVIPEINSPGHMEIWLENLPELQLTNQSTGVKDEVRMDITKDESFDYYTDLIDEYSEVFTSSYWHMGMDEYMLGSGYSNYPQVKQFAQEKWGSSATEDDVVAWYANKINAYVKSKGKTLRVWNDGIIRNSQVVSFDTDIVVEHWNNAASSVAPQTFVDWGHDVVNVSNSLYMVRGSYGINSSGLYNNAAWNVNTFYNGKITSGTEKVRGARISLWPDGGTPAEAENTTEQRLFEPLRFVSQMTWSTTRPWSNYTAFKSAMDEIGRPPLWENAVRQPLPDGAYMVSTGAKSLATSDDSTATLAPSADTLTFAKTTDGYYTIKNSAGQCLDVSRTGTMRLSVPVEIGTGIKFSNCANTTIHRWQIRKVSGGYTIVNAASQQHLSVSSGLTDVPVAGEGFKDVADGLVVQTPADWGKTVWKIVGGISLSSTSQTVTAEPNAAKKITLSVTNTSDSDLVGATVRVKSVPAGWTITPSSTALQTIAVGESASVDFTATNISAIATVSGFEFELVDGSGTVIGQAATGAQAVCATGTIQPTAIAAVSSQQTTGEPAPNGPAAAAIDGNAATYWHTQWSPTETKYPHSIVVDLGSVQDICGLWYTGRSSTGTGGANGRIADYEVYASNTVSAIDGAWGSAVASGTFDNIATAQLAGFAPQEARYVKLVALSEVNGNVWATVGELSAAGPNATPATYTPTATLSVTELEAPGVVTLTGSGFAANEIVKVSVNAKGSATSLLTSDAVANTQGEVTVELSLPQGTAVGEHTVTAAGWASNASVARPIVVLQKADPADPTDPTDPPVVVPAATTTVLSAGSSVAGTQTALTVKVTSGADVALKGTVTITEGKKTLATVPTSNGVASAKVSLSPGKHSLVATFTPTDTKALKASTSAAVIVTTSKAKATVKANLAKTTVTYGKTTSVKVTVAASGLKPTGKVSILSGSKVIASSKVTTASGTVVVTLPKLSAGKHSLSVTYAGDSSVSNGTSSAGKLTVKKQTTKSSLTVSKTGKSITVSVKGGVKPAGKAQLFVDGKKVATKKLSSGKATFTVKKPKSGKHVYLVKYLGDGNSSASSAKKTLKIK